MRRVDITYRITKIGKHAVSVAVCGLLSTACLLPVAQATDYNFGPSAIPGMGSGPVPNRSGIVDSIQLYYYSDGGTDTTVAQTISVVLVGNTRVDGSVGAGGERLAVVSRLYSDGTGDNDRLNLSNTALTLSGAVQVTGIVGGYWDGGAGVAVADRLSGIDIFGQSNSFSFGAIYAANINLNAGSSVEFFGDPVGRNKHVGDALNAVSLNYGGSNSEVTFGDGVNFNGNITNVDISNSTLTFNGSSTITGNIGTNSTAIGSVQLNGPSAVVAVTGALSTDHLIYSAPSIRVTVSGDLYLNVNQTDTAVNRVSFGGSNGTLEVDGSIVGNAAKQVVSTGVNNTGTVTMLGGGQGVTGGIGASGLSILRLNVGAAGSTSTTTVDGDVFAATVSLNNFGGNSSTLTMSRDHSVTGNVVTNVNGLGNLTLAIGTQTVTGTVGAVGAALNTVTSGNTTATSTFTGAIHALNVNNSGAGTSNYQADVTATNVGVLAGTSNFVQGLTATNTTISTGTGNFNTNGTSTTASALAFTGAGTANLHTGLTGTVAYAGNDATVNLWHNRSISGAVSTTTNNTGIFNSRGAGVLSSTVGASGFSVQSLNVNTNNEQTGAADVATRFLLANGNIFATTINLQNNGELRLSDGVNVTGNVTQTPTVADAKQGTLTALGSSTITGNVGSAGAALKTINAGLTGRTVTFDNGVVYSETLSYNGNGTVRFNGLNTTAAAVVNGVLNAAPVLDLGFVGSVDFGTNVTSTGTFTLGDNVDLITQHAVGAAPSTQTTFVDANGATLTFAGSSVVSGQLGSGTLLNGAINTWGSDTFRTINAGADGSRVTFLNDVYALPSTFNITGLGVVNFVGDLNSNLIFQANGSVNVADNKSINGTVSTTVDGQGTLNFVGSASTQATIGGTSTTLRLGAVNFHANSSDPTALPVTAQNENVTIGHNVFALTTTIGTSQNANANATAATISANVFLGNQLTLASSNVTLNTAGSVTTATQAAVDAGTAISLVDFTHTKNANGTLTNTAAVTQSTIGTGAFTTSGGTLNFAIGTTAWADPAGAVQGAGGDINTAASSRITGAAGSTLVMTGTETVNLSLLGSLRNNQAYTLVDVQAGGGAEVPLVLRDNSFVIDTALTRAGGDLVVTATRGATAYITKSATIGHFSNPAALRFGTLAADGQDYSQDMQTVFNILDIDQWGFGNNQANLSTQVRRLAPVANNSYALSAFRAASLVGDSIGNRMHQLRIPEQAQPYEAKGLWVRTVNKSDKSGQQGDYDGFKTNTSGAVLGLDAYPNRDALVGVALGYSTSKVKQQDFRLGDEATVQAAHLTLYGSYNITPQLFIGGQVTRSWVDTEGNRSTAIGRVANANFDSGQTSAKLDLGYRIRLMPDSTVFFTPIASFETSTISQDAYVETNAGAIGLSVASEKFRRTQSGFGLRVDGTTSLGGIVVKPDFFFMATRESGSFAKDVRASYIGDQTNSPQFSTDVLDSNLKNGLTAGLGLGMLLNKTTSMSVRYEYSRIKKARTMQDDAHRSDSLDLAIRWNF